MRTPRRLKARARVALAGVESSVEVAAEIRVEKELAIATRSSQYSAGMAIERARVLTVDVPDVPHRAGRR